MSIGIFILLIYVIAVMNMHYRGRVRFPVSRQILTHTNYFAPYNLMMNLFSALPNRPLLPVDQIQGLEILRENWQTIREEALALQEEGDISVATGLNDVGFNSFFRVGWKRFYLKWYDNYLPSAMEKCPKTVALLNQVPSVKAAMFASLPPGGKLKAHRDPFAGALRYHLGIATPNDDDCYILVDDQRHSWRDGEDVLFDETYIHEAHNDTDTPRIILFCDVYRPVTNKIVDRINRFVCDKIMRISATQNDATEHVGALNRVFAGAYKVRTTARKLKKWNRPVYKTLKYGLFFALIYLLFF